MYDEALKEMECEFTFEHGQRCESCHEPQPGGDPCYCIDSDYWTGECGAYACRTCATDALTA